MWAGFPPDPDAEYRSGAYGSGMEEEFAESQDPVSRQILGIHPQRHGRPRAGRPRDRPRSTEHRRQPVQFVLEGRPEQLRTVPGPGAESLGGRLVPKANLRRLSDAPGPEPKRADAHQGGSHDGKRSEERRVGKE